jgi:hypothetical protein
MRALEFWSVPTGQEPLFLTLHLGTTPDGVRVEIKMKIPNDLGAEYCRSCARFLSAS